MVTLDKRGVPPFVLGIGEFDRDAWNNFINATIMPLARVIEQELTKKLLWAEDLFFRFNSWSLYSYSIPELVSAGAEMVDRMALRRNEWRGWLDLPPDAEMTELLALENYIPADRLGDQSKLTGGEYMTIHLTAQTVITAAALVGAVSALAALLVKLIHWIDRQKAQDRELRDVQSELTLLTYGVLVCLKGLKERGCNGPVTDAINKIEKHINQKAHEQGGTGA